MATRQKAQRLHTPKGIACFVTLKKPKQRVNKKTGQPEGEPKYSLILCFPSKVDLTDMEEAADAAGRAKFGADWDRMKAKGKVNWPFRDNDEYEENGAPFDKPGTFVAFKTTDKPGIVDEDGEPILDMSEVYSGMECRVSCRPFGYDNESKGVAFALVNVQKLGEGERLSGNPNAEDDFKDAAPAKGKAAKSRRDSMLD